ncbi:MAG: hypothetical protein NW237_14140 [Cyanobacteriota bacterium]|nr:hypothetical protein [Cyanobacteriota bacterium]
MEGDIDLDGYIQVGFNPEIETSLWGSPPGLSTARLKLFVLPKIGLNFYVRGEVELLPDEIGVEIEQPQSGSTLAGNESIVLRARASGDPKLALLAGVDLTLRDGSVEECSDSQPSSTSALTTKRTLLNTATGGVSYKGICECKQVYVRDGVDLATVPEPPSLPPLPRHTTCNTHGQNTRDTGGVNSRKKCYAGSPFESHHIIQEAAVKGINGYPTSKSTKAYTVLLSPSDHQKANAAQPRPRPAGTYSSERDIAINALTAANLQGDEVTKQIECADTFFYSLGFQDDTITNAVN